MFVPTGEATILHADLDAFYASVEQRDDPRLRGRPVIVGAGVVLACSYEAKAYGVRTAMNGGQAYRRCPQAIVVQPRMSAYSEASKAVFKVFEDTTPLVEGISIDEAFLDVGGLRKISGTPVDIARRLRSEVLARVGLPITVGVARTKFLAKVASGVAKPDGLLEVPPDQELEFLHPLAVERLWGVGEVTAEKLRNRGLTTVGDVAILPEAALVAMLGRASGRHLHALAHNRDPRPIEVGRMAAFDRIPARSWPVPQVRGDAGRGTGRAGGSGDAADAIGGPGRADGHAAAAVRRLQPGDPVTYVASGNWSDAGDFDHRKGVDGGCQADDRETGDHDGRDLGRESGERGRGATGAAVRQGCQ